MEPITTSIAVSGVVSYLVEKLKDNKSINSFFSDFTDASVNWLRPIFLKDDEPKEIIKSLQKNPDDDLNQRDVSTAIERNVRQDPEAEKFLKEMYKDIVNKGNGSNSTKINNSKNVNTGNVTTGGGNFVIGDNSQTNK